MILQMYWGQMNLSLVTPFTKPLSECKALLHTFVKYGFVKLFLQAPTFFFLFFRLHNNNKKIGKNLQLKIDLGHGLVIAKTDPPCPF